MHLFCSLIARLLLNSIPLYGYTILVYLLLLLLSIIISGHLAWFYFLTTVNNSASTNLKFKSSKDWLVERSLTEVLRVLWRLFI